MQRLEEADTEIIRLAEDWQAGDGLSRAVEVLEGGGLVAFPTESFYGLGADIFSESALRRLFAAKGRRPDQPVLILVESPAAVEGLVKRVPPVALDLMRLFWPGGLTLVFEAGERVSPILTAGTGKIGIRWSSHPVAAALPKALGRPVTGTSANRSGAPPCVDARRVAEGLGGRVDLILDGGRTVGGPPSTVLDVTGEAPVFIREGAVTRDAVARAIGVRGGA